MRPTFGKDPLKQFTKGFAAAEDEGEDEVAYQKQIADFCDGVVEPVCPTMLRDKCNSLQSLVKTCYMALTHPDWKGQEYTKKNVAGVLCDYVERGLEEIELGLQSL